MQLSIDAKSASSFLNYAKALGLFKEFIASKEKSGEIYMENSSLHVRIDQLFSEGCICNFANFVSDIENLTYALLKIFSASEVVYHVKRRSDRVASPEVALGNKSLISYLPGSFKGDALCGTYPVIIGLPMRWEFREN